MAERVQSQADGTAGILLVLYICTCTVVSCPCHSVLQVCAFLAYNFRYMYRPVRSAASDHSYSKIDLVVNVRSDANRREQVHDLYNVHADLGTNKDTYQTDPVTFHDLLALLARMEKDSELEMMDARYENWNG